MQRVAPGTFEHDAQQLNLEYMLSLPVSSLSYNFKNTSKLPLGAAVPFGGWETPYGPRGDDRGHFTGHWLSASALMVAATGNATLAANAKELVSTLAACQEANAKVYPKFGPGYLSGFPTTYFDCLENLWHRPCRYMQVGGRQALRLARPRGARAVMGGGGQAGARAVYVRVAWPGAPRRVAAGC